MMHVTRIRLAILTILMTPAAVMADFSLEEIPQFVQDQTPNWIFQILSSILFALSELFIGMLTGMGTA